MPESLKTRIKRWIYNFYPVYRRTGARIVYMDDYWREVRVSIPLRIWTRNYYGTISGISMFGAVDPMYMMMLIKLLGPDYVVWDKQATIYFKKPGKTQLTACFQIDDNELNLIRKTLESEPSITRTYPVDLKDKTGGVCSTIDKVIHIKKSSLIINYPKSKDSISLYQLMVLSAVAMFVFRPTKEELIGVTEKMKSAQ